MKINDVDFVPVTETAREEILANFDAVIAADPDRAPLVARAVAECTGMSPTDIVARGLKAAGKLSAKKAGKLDEQMRKSIGKARDAQRRGYVARVLDEASRLADFEADMEKERRRRAVRRALDAEEAATSGERADEYADGAAVVARIAENGGAQTREPDAGGVRNDGVHLGYRAKTHAIVGAPESGKTLATIAMACDEIRAGGSVLHLDSDDNSEDDTFALYLAFGIDPEILADPTRFRYSAVRTAEGARRFVADADDWRPTMAILDAVAPFMALFGFNPNDNAEYRVWHGEIPARLSALGASVWQIDHVNRTDGDSFRYAGGAGQKLGAISGVQYGVTVVEPFVPGQGGASALKILKDRPGGVRAASPSGKTPTAAVFRLDSRGGTSTWEFWRGRESEDREDEQAEADVAHVLTLDPFPTSRAVLQAALKASQGRAWRNDRAQAALAEARRRRESATTTFPIESKE